MVGARNLLVLLAVFAAVHAVALAEKEDSGSDEVTTVQQEDTSVYSSSTEDEEDDVQSHMLDSHEAMHNRDPSSARARNKRGFEFLLGLINNNSRYEITRVDPEQKEKKTAPQGQQAGNLLLELIVKIAKHPDQWNKVHELLQSIDKDLLTSRNIVEQYSHVDPHASTTSATTDSTRSTKPMTPAASKPENKTDIYEEKRERYKSSPFKDNVWPVFDDEPKFVTYSRKPEPVHRITESSRPVYPKNFAYHRVTGKPAHLKKNPTAYIAVSVIQPKRLEEEEDIVLENELRKLKPWRHQSWDVQKKSGEETPLQ